MSRRLPLTISADKTPDWLPPGWIAESRVLKRGREVRTYTQLKTGKKFTTKDHVLHYVEMEKARQERYAKVYTDLSTERRYYSKVAVLQHLASLKHQALPETPEEENIDEFNMITYSGSEEDEDSPENQGEPDARSPSRPSRQSKRLRLNSPATRQQLVVGNQTMENSDWTASSGLDVELRCEPARNSAQFVKDIPPKEELTESGIEETDARNVELSSNRATNDKESNLTCGSDSTKDEATKQRGDKSKEPLKMQDLNEGQLLSEETVNGSRQLLFFPFSGASSGAQNLLTSVASVTSSAEYLSNCKELASTRIIEDKNICGNKIQKKSAKTYSSKETEKKNPQAPCSTEQLKEGVEKSSTSTAADQNEPLTPHKVRRKAFQQYDVVYCNPSHTSTSVLEGSPRNSNRPAKQQTENWPKPSPYFTFEPPTVPHLINNNDLVIRRYLEQHSASIDTAGSNSSLPDFGLPSFSQISLDKADERPAVVKRASLDPSCSQPVSPSLASSSFVGSIAGN